MSIESGPQFLKEKYDLHKAPEVQSAVDQTEAQTGERVPNNPAEKIEVYLKRLERLTLDPEQTQDKKDLGDVLHTERPRALALLRQMIINEYILPNKDKMAEGAARVEERAARQIGVDVQYGEEQLEQRGEIAVGDLESSLDQWITYLSDPNEPYPTWFRYYAFRNILDLGEYDKDKQEFPKRSKGTFKLFPDIDRGALAYMQEIMEASQDDETLNRRREAQKTLGDTPDEYLLTKEGAKAFASLSFAKQYAEGIKQNGDISPELRADTRGEWVHYQQGTDPKPLWLSLQGKGVAWCTKGYPTAETQLKGGDFYVYYTLDTQGIPIIPRIAIRMKGDKKIAEDPRGAFDTQQNLEPNMIAILDEKLKDFGPEAEKFQKKSADMKHMTAVEKKVQEGQELTEDDIIFLYEVNSSIQGFGYTPDPRIKDILSQRDAKEDLSGVFRCAPGQISLTDEEALGGDIIFHHGDLDLDNLTSAEGLTLPSTIGGYLDLNGLTSAEGLTLPSTVGGYLDLNGLTSAEGLTLPSTVGGYLNLRSLTSAEGLTLPSTIDGYLNLRSLTSAEGLTLPSTIGGYLDLDGLTSAEGLTLPSTVGGNLDLNGLTSAEGLTLPSTVGGDLYLNRLTSAEGLTLPSTVGGYLDLNGLTSAEGLTLPSTIGEHLNLRSLTSAEGLTLPSTIGGYLNLNGLTSAEIAELRRKRSDLSIR